MKVKFIEKDVSQSQINYGNNDSPINLLEVNKSYDLALVDIHSSHTYIYLKDFPNKKFNSIWFKWGKYSKLDEFPKKLIMNSYNYKYIH